jgi:predicted dehydrogenase
MTGRFRDWNNAAFTSTTDSSQIREIAGDTNVFVAQLEDLAMAIEKKAQPTVPLIEGAASLRLALAARQAADERREIRLDHAP